MEELICKKKKTKGDKISWKKLYNLLFVNPLTPEVLNFGQKNYLIIFLEST